VTGTAAFAKQGGPDMNSRTISHISKALFSLIFAASLIFPAKFVQAQEYSEEEYKAFQDIQAEKDAAKKTDMIVKFLKEKPKNPLRPNIVAEFQKTIVELQQAKQWAQIISLGDKFLDVAPDDSLTIKALTAAYSGTKNTKGFATFGEKAYAASPNAQLAYYLALAYLELGNDAKFVQYGEKSLAANPDNIEILSGMIKKSTGAPQQKYAKMCLKVLPTAKKREEMDNETWKTTVNNAYAMCYAVLGAAAYEARNYSEAINHFTGVVKYFKRNESAYYHLGLCYWQVNKLDAAMLNFAKAYLLKGSTAASAKKYLEQLWASGHQGKLTGVERVIDRAQQDLK
jgi:tetratricopeptide (TPR) repeat protein